MRDEDFYIDTSAQHLFVLFRRGDPASYFFFPAEFTLPKLIKWKDIEPARIVRRKIKDTEFELVLTRVHYWSLIVWINPEKYQSAVKAKPVIGFSRNFHTPYLFKVGHTERRFDIQSGKNLNKKDKVILAIAMKAFKPKSQWSLDEPRSYPGIALEIKKGILANDQSFDNLSISKNSAILILVGDANEVNSVASWLKATNTCIPFASLQQLF